MPNTTTQVFIKCLKQLIARRGKPRTVYSDNAKSFQAAVKWLKQIIKSEQLHELKTICDNDKVSRTKHMTKLFFNIQLMMAIFKISNLIMLRG